MSLLKFLSKFPIKQYEPEDIFDYALDQDLSKRTFYYRSNNDTSNTDVIPSFSLLVNEYNVDPKDNIIFSTDPDCLFIQCLLAKKYQLLLPLDNKDINGTNWKSNAKLLSVNTENLPMLLLSSCNSSSFSSTKNNNNCDSNYITRNEIMDEVSDKYFTIKERQWSNILDATVLSVWKRQINDKDDNKYSNNTTINDQYNYEKAKCRSTLNLFEKEYVKLFNGNDNTYIKLKLDTLIYCILHGPQVPIKDYIQSTCPTLSKIELPSVYLE